MHLPKGTEEKTPFKKKKDEGTVSKVYNTENQKKEKGGGGDTGNNPGYTPCRGDLDGKDRKLKVHIRGTINPRSFGEKKLDKTDRGKEKQKRVKRQKTLFPAWEEKTACHGATSFSRLGKEIEKKPKGAVKKHVGGG